jgi:hypothetical protein
VVASPFQMRVVDQFQSMIWRKHQPGDGEMNRVEARSLYSDWKNSRRLREGYRVRIVERLSNVVNGSSSETIKPYTPHSNISLGGRQFGSRPNASISFPVGRWLDQHCLLYRDLLCKLR